MIMMKNNKETSCKLFLGNVWEIKNMKNIKKNIDIILHMAHKNIKAPPIKYSYDGK